jgi:hypothetical protein
MDFDYGVCDIIHVLLVSQQHILAKPHGLLAQLVVVRKDVFPAIAVKSFF